MVNENDYYRPMMPNYEYYPQGMHRPMYYDDQTYYYHPYMNANFYPPPVNGMNHVHPAYYANPPTQEGAAPNAESVTSANLMQQFMDENGQVDIQKMLQTVGQLADTVNQVSPVIKQLNDLIRNFRA